MFQRGAVNIMLAMAQGKVSHCTVRGKPVPLLGSDSLEKKKKDGLKN